MVEEVKDAIREKETLLSRMATQIGTASTAELAYCLKRAKLNLTEVTKAVKQNNMKLVMYHYGRLCFCLGQIKELYTP